MDTIFERLIVDFHGKDLPPLTPRRASLPWLSGKVDTVIGMRRSGKTWFLFQVMQDLIRNGIPKEGILYLNMEDERLYPLSVADLHLIPDAFYRLYPGMRDRECAFFFDEIQNVDGWERFIRRLVDTEKVHICLTGSSARFLSREIGTSMRGRSLSTEIFPFSFLEALLHQKIAVEEGKRPAAKLRSVLENRFNAYLIEGGFPETQGIAENHRIQILQEYLDVVILRDLVERHRITNVSALRYMIRHILNAPGTLFSVNKFYNDLRSQGLSCTKDTLHDYLSYLSDAYLFFPILVHSRSERARMVNPRKVYIIDTGLITACSRSIKPEWGRLLENLVFLELRRRYSEVEYYRTGSGKEVDFIIRDKDAQYRLIQVTAEFTNEPTRERELAALNEAMKECGLREATVVTLHDEERIETEAGRIQALPAWLWVLLL
jgi:hypothetical protein